MAKAGPRRLPPHDSGASAAGRALGWVACFTVVLTATSALALAALSTRLDAPKVAAMEPAILVDLPPIESLDEPAPDASDVVSTAGASASTPLEAPPEKIEEPGSDEAPEEELAVEPPVEAEPDPQADDIVEAPQPPEPEAIQEPVEEQVAEPLPEPEPPVEEIVEAPEVTEPEAVEEPAEEQVAEPLPEPEPETPVEQAVTEELPVEPAPEDPAVAEQPQQAIVEPEETPEVAEDMSAPEAPVEAAPADEPSDTVVATGPPMPAPKPPPEPLATSEVFERKQAQAFELPVARPEPTAEMREVLEKERARIAAAEREAERRAEAQRAEARRQAEAREKEEARRRAERRTAARQEAARPTESRKGNPAPQARQATSRAAAAAATNSYNVEVRRAIERQKRYPARARPAEGTVRVSFTIGAGGGITGARLARSSGNSALDQAAMDAVKRARVPPIPKDVGKNSMSFTVPMTFSIR